MNRLLSLVVLISLYASGVVSSKCAESTCPLFEDGVTEWELTLFPVPSDCTQYIMCQRGYKHYRPCPEGLHFNSVLNVCDYPKDAKCTECVEEIIEECAEPKECPTFEDGVTEWDLTLLPVPANCNKFIMCQRGYRHLMDCPSTLHFNPVLNVCDYPERAGCKGCGTPGTEAPVTEAPETEAPETEAPETEAPETEAPETEAPETEAPETEAPETEAPETEAPETEAPETEAPATEAPETEAPATCEISCESDSKLPFNIGNPLDCTKFYICYNNKPIASSCPKGLNFDVNTKICNLPKNAECAACTVETEAPTTTTEAATTTTTEAPVDKCATPKCPADKSLVLLPVPSSCNKFVTCIYGHSWKVECPFGLNFDQEEKICTLPKYARCSNCGKCETPKCPSNKALAILPVPRDCSKFLTCIYGRGTELSCPDGLLFDTKTNLCTVSLLAKCESC